MNRKNAADVNKITLMDNITIDLSTLYEKTAKLQDLEIYLTYILEKAGEGNRVILTGKAPIWLYLKAAHELHGKAASLHYESPVTGRLEIFNHDPF